MSEIKRHEALDLELSDAGFQYYLCEDADPVIESLRAENARLKRETMSEIQRWCPNCEVKAQFDEDVCCIECGYDMSTQPPLQHWILQREGGITQMLRGDSGEWYWSREADVKIATLKAENAALKAEVKRLKEYEERHKSMVKMIGHKTADAPNPRKG